MYRYTDCRTVGIKPDLQNKAMLSLSKYISLFIRMVAALIMLQTLFFKFAASEESVYIFTKIGLEPWGRWGSGALELAASILLLIPVTAWLGSLLGIALMSGALFFHFTTLGFAVMDDGGYLFFLCLVVLICCLYVFWTSLFSLPVFMKQRLPKFLLDYMSRVKSEE